MYPRFSVIFGVFGDNKILAGAHDVPLVKQALRRHTDTPIDDSTHAQPCVHVPRGARRGYHAIVVHLT